MARAQPQLTPVSMEPGNLLLRQLAPDAVARVCALASPRQLAEQQYLCRQDSDNHHVFNVVVGLAAVERLSASGRRQILAFMFPGDFVGLSESTRYAYTVRSLTELSCLSLPQRALFSLCDEIPALKANVQNLQSLVLARTLEQLYLLGQKRAHEKICTFLLQLLERLPGASPARIDLPMTRLDIADYLGLTPETVIRAFTGLRRNGVIGAPAAQAVSILDLAQVRALGDIQ